MRASASITQTPNIGESALRLAACLVVRMIEIAAHHAIAICADQRATSACVYGDICPAEGKGAGLVLPRCNTKG